MDILRYSVPSPVLFGAGALSRLAGEAAEHEISKALVVTDRGIRASGILARALDGLGGRENRVSVFDAVSSNPREEDVLSALDLYRGAGADGLIALGGGSAIDAAKAVRLLVAHEGTIADYDFLRGGMKRIVNALPPLLAVPTTAGTGSEVSRGALVITRRGDVVRKTVIASPRLVPSLALLDPELTVGLPARMTAGTGIDALSHAVEEHLSPRYHPVVDAIALRAAGMIAAALPRAFREPADLEARADMLLAAMMGGIGFEKGLGAIHSLSHAIGALHDLHHGTLNAVIQPAALEFNRAHTRPGALRELATAVGIHAATDEDALERVVDWLRGLNAELGIPPRLRDLKDIARDREEILARALDDHCHRTNPRPCAREDFVELWERVY
jgi:alcohol dehydrogenase class IV